MLASSEISEFGIILLFLIAGIFFVVAGFITSWLIRPHRPNEEKNKVYECGEDPIGNAWGQFNNRFYIIALVFILFEVELVILFPWAVIFGRKELIIATQGLWGVFSLLEAFIFVGLLVLGLVYVWAKGYLEWVRPQTKVNAFKGPVPLEIYQKLNQINENLVKKEEKV